MLSVVSGGGWGGGKGEDEEDKGAGFWDFGAREFGVGEAFVLYRYVLLMSYLCRNVGRFYNSCFAIITERMLGVDFCPILPDIAAILLTHMSEACTYLVLREIIRMFHI